MEVSAYLIENNNINTKRLVRLYINDKDLKGDIEYLKMSIQTSENTTIATSSHGNVSIPKLTAEQIIKAYNQVVSGGSCTITDKDGKYHLVVNQADELNEEIAIGILYYNTVALTYIVDKSGNVDISAVDL